MATDTKTITVNDITVVDAGSLLVICSTAPTVALNISAFPTGGIWSRAGIIDGVFNPASVGVGTFMATYTLTNDNNCTSNDIREIEVVNPDPIDAGENMIVCINSGLVNLDDDVSIVGGTWSGTGISQNTFDPAFANLDTHILTYTYDNGFGCIATDIRTILVKESISVTVGANRSACINSTAINLDLLVDQTGGQWSGPGVSDNIFLAADAGIGLHILTYTFNDAFGCTATDLMNIDVNDLTAVDAGPVRTTICSTSGLFNLHAAVSPSGGTWSGPGVDAATGEFNPALVGVGEFDLIYTFEAASGCSNADVRTMVVVTPDPIDAGENLVLCIDSEKKTWTSMFQ